jgi:hypothetical protein
LKSRNQNRCALDLARALTASSFSSTALHSADGQNSSLQTSQSTGKDIQSLREEANEKYQRRIDFVHSQTK